MGNRGGAKLAVSKNGGQLIMYSNEKNSGTHASAGLLTSEDGTRSFSVNHKSGARTFISTTEIGGFLSVFGANHNKNLASISVSDDGDSGMISVNRYERGKKIGSAKLETDKNGGRLDVFGNYVKSFAGIRVNDDGGRVFAYGKAAQSNATLGVDEYGGRVDLCGKGEGKAAIGINEYGNGAVSTWDKNGYRQ